MPTASLALAAFALIGVGSARADVPLGEGPQRQAAAGFHGRFEPRTLYVKFHDDLMVRLDAGQEKLTDRGTGVLTPPITAAMTAVGGMWSRVHEASQERLEALRATASKNLGRATPDHNSEFFLKLREGAVLEQAADALRKLAIVQHVGLVPRPAELPVAPDFSASQGYLYDAGIGHGSTALWPWPGGRGENVRVADLEYGWNLAHVDFPAITRLGPAGTDPFNNPNHGTAVLGILFARNDGVGTTGMCHAATGHVVPTYRNGIWNVATAITTSLETLQPGDILLLEQQTFGPNHPGGSSQLGLVPCDWVLPWYNAVVTATGNGVTVIEAAANGSQNLDDPVYSTGNDGHWPFLPENDSGAILVGGGLTPSYLADDRVRLISSNYGSAVDVQSFAAFVTTTGFGQLYSVEGPNVFYTGSFSGTSSASAIVAGAAAQLQSLHIHLRRAPLSPAAVREALRTTGLPQQGTASLPASQSIGPRPNLVGAAFESLGAADCDNNGVPDEVDIALTPSLDADISGRLDLCENACRVRESVMSNAAQLIPDGGGASIVSTVNAAVSEGQLIGVVAWVELSHLFAGDISIVLSHGSTVVPLVVRAGRAGSGDGDSSDFEGRYVFSDGASADLWAAAAAAGAAAPIAPGVYAPSGEWTGVGPAPASLSSFLDEEAGGVWTLSVTDGRSGDRGTLIRWGLVLTVRSADCCLADFDGNGTPGVPDIFAFLSAWFAGDSAADVDANGTVAVPDIFAFLSAWFAGCP